VIEDFLLTEANKQLQTPYERYQSAFAEFMSEMDAWQSAANEAQVRLTMEQLSIDDRRRQLDTPNGSPEVPAARINSLMEGFSIRMVVRQYIATLLSPTDSTGRPKPIDNLEIDKRRAAIVLDIGKNYDTNEVARRIYSAMKAGSKVDLQEIVRRYIQDELRKRESGN
jgi:hypothetical protein